MPHFTEKEISVILDTVSIAAADPRVPMETAAILLAIHEKIELCQGKETADEFAKNAAYALLVEGVNQGWVDLTADQSHRNTYDCIAEELGHPAVEIPVGINA